MYRFFCFFLFFTGFINSQDSIGSFSVGEANAEYFKLPRENLFLHLNKSTYVDGEEIWFKGYAYDQKNKLPSLGTNNINIELFTDAGKSVYKGLFLATKGSFIGNIKIDSTWVGGTYYLRASTNWMNNFDNDQPYYKELKILKESIPKNRELDVDISYDFQLFPEGGHLVSGVKSVLGFKLTNTIGYGVEFEYGEVIDDTGKGITTFKCNHLGMGKFTMIPVLGRKYEVTVYLKNGEEIKVFLPKIEPKGFVMSVNNALTDNVHIELGTNLETFDNLTDNKHYILIRQNHLSKKISVDFESDVLEKIFSLKRQMFFKGINTITLFQGDSPIAERLIFNSFDEISRNVEISNPIVEKDSLAFKLNLLNNDDVLYDLSVSVLPENTKSYNFIDNIYSALLLRPYVRGVIEDEKYYFTNIDAKKRYDLDVLLITQGWSKYRWEDIFNANPKISYKFNQGMVFKGKLQGSNKEDVGKLYIYPTLYHPARFIEVDKKDYSFTIPSFFAGKGETIKVSGVKHNGAFVRPSIYIQTYLDQFKIPFGRVFKFLSNPDIEGVKETENIIKAPQNFIADNVQVLEEVLLKTEKEEKQEKENTSSVAINKYFKDNSTKITKRMAKDFPTVLDYLQSLGTFYVIDQRPFSADITIATNNGPVKIFLDGRELRVDNSILSVTRTSEIDRIYIDKVNYGLGARSSFGGSVRIYTRKLPFSENKNIVSNSTQYKFKKGFEPVKEFYNPGYSNYLDINFIDYGAIYWQPTIFFNEKGIGKLKIPNTGLDNIKLFIEGMASDGSLISKMLEVNTANATSKTLDN
ncbi:hypothetical protein [Aquimarina algicola]|uniref:TonB-dependent receptor plug domain-containing protein n=1 Tax=Aquimarina algicola TaxID=2589995 RepID=A0A504JN71_9FLAO|nr:hypothetical protein [Aquimarina algicola]TPN87860.1 hypothetical protein FHK87_09815 [Aquimarina algicola]